MPPVARERDLHDGAQQRLVALALELGRLEERAEADPELRRAIARTKGEAEESLRELREGGAGPRAAGTRDSPMGNPPRPHPLLDSTRRPRNQGNGVTDPRIIRLTAKRPSSPSSTPIQTANHPDQRPGDAAWTPTRTPPYQFEPVTLKTPDSWSNPSPVDVPDGRPTMTGPGEPR